MTLPKPLYEDEVLFSSNEVLWFGTDGRCYEATWDEEAEVYSVGLVAPIPGDHMDLVTLTREELEAIVGPW